MQYIVTRNYNIILPWPTIGSIRNKKIFYYSLRAFKPINIHKTWIYFYIYRYITSYNICILITYITFKIYLVNCSNGTKLKRKKLDKGFIIACKLGIYCIPFGSREDLFEYINPIWDLIFYFHVRFLWIKTAFCHDINVTKSELDWW